MNTILSNPTEIKQLQTKAARYCPRCEKWMGETEVWENPRQKKGCPGCERRKSIEGRKGER